MKVYYDSEHNACAVKFEKEDVVFIYNEEDGLEIHSSDGGKPEIIEKQLLFSVEESNG